MDRGMYGYPFSLRMGNIVVLYGGRPEMGIHLSMTGAGCREYENIGRVPWSVRSVSCLRLKRNLRVWTSPWTTTSDTGQLKKSLTRPDGVNWYRNSSRPSASKKSRSATDRRREKRFISAPVRRL